VENTLLRWERIPGAHAAERHLFERWQGLDKEDNAVASVMCDHVKARWTWSVIASSDRDINTYERCPSFEAAVQEAEAAYARIKDHEERKAERARAHAL